MIRTIITILPFLININATPIELSSSETGYSPDPTPPFEGNFPILSMHDDPLVEIFFDDGTQDLNSIPYDELNSDSSMGKEDVIEILCKTQDWYNRIFFLKECFPQLDTTDTFFRLDKILSKLYDHLGNFK